jgi:hypothetical protein
MAIIRSALKLIIREYSNYDFQPPVLTLGVPEVYATPDELKQWLPKFAKTESKIDADEVEMSSNKIGKKLGWVNSKTFFDAFGWSDVTSIDVPGSEYKPDIIHDLNNQIPDNLADRFNLIVDPGTIEHVFDVKTCLSNVVNMLKVGGVVAHLVPIYSYNGGYYSINPNVLNDFYAANGFCDIKSYVIMWDRYKAFTDSKSLCYEYSQEIMGGRHALTQSDQYRYSPHLLLFARKEKVVDEITAPLQFMGEYGEGHASKASAKNTAKLAAALYRVLPFEMVFRLQSVAYRLLLANKIKKASFWI